MGNGYQEQNRQSFYQNSRNNQGENKQSLKPAVKIVSFYEDNKKTVDPDLFDGKAKEIAESLLGSYPDGNKVGVTSTQLRRIFDEVKRFEQILLLSSDQWEKQLPYIKMIKSKIAYTVARAAKQKSSENGVYKNLEIFISSSIDCIEKEEDYHIFVSLFEAVYGFYYELAPKKYQ